MMQHQQQTTSAVQNDQPQNQPSTSSSPDENQATGQVKSEFTTIDPNLAYQAQNQLVTASTDLKTDNLSNPTNYDPTAAGYNTATNLNPSNFNFDTSSSLNYQNGSVSNGLNGLSTQTAPNSASQNGFGNSQSGLANNSTYNSLGTASGLNSSIQGSYNYTNGGSYTSNLAVDPSAVQNPSTLQDPPKSTSTDIKPFSSNTNYMIGSIIDTNGVPMNGYNLTSLSTVGNDGATSNSYSTQLTNMAGTNSIANGTTGGLNSLNGANMNSNLNTTGLNGSNLNGPSLNSANLNGSSYSSGAIPPITSYNSNYGSTNTYSTLPSSSTLQNSQLTSYSYPNGTNSPSNNQYSNYQYQYSSGSHLTSLDNYYTNPQVGVLEETYYPSVAGQYYPENGGTASSSLAPMKSEVATVR